MPTLQTEYITILGADAKILIWNKQSGNDSWITTRVTGGRDYYKSYVYKARPGVYLMTFEITGNFLWMRFGKHKTFEVEINGQMDMSAKLLMEEN